MFTFDPRKCELEDTWLTISEAEEVANPLRDFSQMHEDELVESLKSREHLYGVGHRTVASSASGRFGAVTVDDLLA